MYAYGVRKTLHDRSADTVRDEDFFSAGVVHSNTQLNPNTSTSTKRVLEYDVCS
jgi:hypothetical protein